MIPDNHAPIPMQMIMYAPGLDVAECAVLAREATDTARRLCPKMFGTAAGALREVHGPGFFGVRWQHAYVWHQERGTQPFTMKTLAGKTIPMWIDDPRGKMRRENPKIKTRTTKSGRVQVLIFRRAAKIGARKRAQRRVNGRWRNVDVPASYPGAPGRIAGRHAARPHTTEGKTPGAVRRFNVGVRWRFPGLAPRGFLHHGVHQAAVEAHIRPRAIHAE